VTFPRQNQDARTGPAIPPSRNSLGVVLIALFKFFKGFILLAVGVGALSLVHKDVALEVARWIDAFRIDPHNFYVQRLLGKIYFLNAHRLRQLSAGTFFYAGLLLTEGAGLLSGKRWGRYFTIIITTSFIPLELYEIAKRITFPRMAVLLTNIAIVAYLVLELRRNSERL
jgi:uncharacterized membrane protein (DUF2068 family)